MDTPTLARTLRTLRTAAGLTLDALATRSGVSRATLAALESGANRNPRLATIDAIAAPLGVSTAALLGLSTKVGIRSTPLGKTRVSARTLPSQAVRS